MTQEEIDEWGRVRDDMWTFLRLFFTIEDATGKRTLIPGFFPEQLIWLEALVTHFMVIGLKPRQVGFTTITVGFFCWKLFTGSRSRLCAQVVNDQGTLDRVVRMVRVFHQGMNQWPQLATRAKPDNDDEFRFSHNEAGFRRILAGGGGQGRSWSYTDIHATEMSKWKRRSSALRGDDQVVGVDETWASILNSSRETLTAGSHIVVESTGAGPFGLFYDLKSKACRPGSPWHFVFTSWTGIPAYRIRLTPEQEVSLRQELTATEAVLVRDHGVDLEQIAWRRSRLELYGRADAELLFKRDFPLTDEEPFELSLEQAWFARGPLHRMLRYVPQAGHSTERYVEFHPPDGRPCVIGADSSGGVGGDEASFFVLRKDLVQVARWTANDVPPREQGYHLAMVARRYGGALCVVEGNKYGKEVAEAAESYGANVWRDKERRLYWSGGEGRDCNTPAYSATRELVDGDLLVVNDAETVRQMMRVVNKNGKIEGATGLDDRADSCAQAVFGAEALGWNRYATVRTAQDERDRVAREVREKHAEIRLRLGVR